MTVVNPNFMKEIKKYSTKDFSIDACFNCGNCTAVCPLSEEKFQFPRALIRYAQVGLKNKVLSNDLMWLCASCNDCTNTCPRDAEPGEFVVATRRWAMGQYEITGISRFLYTHWWAPLLTAGLIFFLSLFLFLSFSTPDAIPLNRPIRLFDLVSSTTVEIVGIGMATLVIGIIGLSILNQYRIISKYSEKSLFLGISRAYETRKTDKELNSFYHLLFSPFIMIKQALVVIFKEVLLQYRQLECSISSYQEQKKWNVRSLYINHMLIMWGFLGLGAATMTHFLTGKDSNEFIPITDPIRLLGIISGILLMIGVTSAIWGRYQKSTRYSEHSNVLDWLFLFELFFIGLSGFLMTISFYISEIPPILAYWFFVFHMIVVIELVLMSPFNKMSHVWYRSFALWLHYGLIARKNKLSNELKKIKEAEKARKKREKAKAKVTS